MPITFTVNHKDNYFISSFEGLVTDDELLSSFITFYESEQWVPGMNELSDLSKGDGSLITTQGLEKFAIATQEIFRKHGVEFSKTAVYAPQDLAFGLSRMYEVMISESPECFCVFRDIDKAKSWLAEEQQSPRE